MFIPSVINLSWRPYLYIIYTDLCTLKYLQYNQTRYQHFCLLILWNVLYCLKVIYKV